MRRSAALLILASLAAPGCHDERAEEGGGVITNTFRVSVDSFGTEATGGGSVTPAVSSDGRFVAFASDATNLVPGDSNGAADIFWHDSDLGTTLRVSVDSNGVQGNAASASPSISADARYVAFQSAATNLVSGDTNGATDIFVRDVFAGVTTRVSVDSAGAQVAAASSFPSISSDGRWVAFQSTATTLVSGDTNGVEDVFVRDTVTGQTLRMSVTSSGAEATGGGSGLASISSDGRYVAFESSATNLVTGDTNGAADVFVRDRVFGTTIRASVAPSGAQATGGGSANASISADGRFVAFESGATNLFPGDANGVSDVFLRDTVDGLTHHISVDSGGTPANGASTRPSVSSDGRFAVFESDATNLVPDDTNGLRDVFFRDLFAGTFRLSVGSGESEALGGASTSGRISADARHAVFQSSATNLVSGDGNGASDIFLRGPLF